MEQLLYVMLIERGKTYNKMNKAAAERHVDNIRRLDNSGKLALCAIKNTAIIVMVNRTKL